jgi:8-oxo-dGTP diphosphatase
MTAGAILQFGDASPGVTYRLRPGGYAIIRDGSRRVALVSTKQGLFLPGGGQEAGETPEEAAIREVHEECGFRIRIISAVGVADEMAFSTLYGEHYRKRCTFFVAALMDHDPSRMPDHDVVWMTEEEAAARLSHASQRWAIDIAKEARP